MEGSIFIVQERRRRGSIVAIPDRSVDDAAAVILFVQACHADLKVHPWGWVLELVEDEEGGAHAKGRTGPSDAVVTVNDHSRDMKGSVGEGEPPVSLRV